MKVCQFNFNNEVNTFEIHVEDDGRVIVPGENDQILAEYDNVQQLAEIYAQARDVKPENLKNWTLLENGNVYSFVLRAGTAGVNVSDVEERLEDVFASLGSRHHALSIARAKEQIMSDGAVDLVEALVHCSETEVARDVYDAMSAEIAGTDVPATAEEAPAVEEDTRTDLERYIDSMEEVPGAIAFLAMMAGLTVDAEKAAIVAAFQNNVAMRNVSTLKAAYENAINDVISDGIGVNTVADALTVITQIAAGRKDDALKNKLTYTMRMAGRKSINIAVDIVGQNHIRHTAELVSVDELEGADLLVRGNVPYIVRFSDTVDQELEAERNAAAASEEDERTAVQDELDDYEDEEDAYEDEEDEEEEREDY